jgi:hypothetical protein
LRGFGRRSLILKLPNPLTPPSPLRGEGDHGRAHVTLMLTLVSTSVTSQSSLLRRTWRGGTPRHGSEGGARGRVCSLLPGGLGIMSPGITTGVGGASLDWDRRRRVTPVQTASQEAWPEAEPLGWNNSLRREPWWNAGKRARSERARAASQDAAVVTRRLPAFRFLLLFVS